MSWRGIARKMGLVSDGANVDVQGLLTASGGTPIIGVPFGTAYFVDYRNGVDTNDGLARDKAFKTLSAAVAAVTTNNNDIIFIDGDSTVVETAMVTLSKNRVHIVGVNGTPNPMGFGAAAKVQCAASATASNIAVFKNTGVRNTFTNIKFDSALTVAQGLYSVVEGGEYARYFNCEIYKSTDLDATGAAELVCNGDSPSFIGCTIGSSANAISGAIIRANVLFTKGLAGSGKVARDAYFERCMIWRRSSNTTNRFVYGANADDIERSCIFKSCVFWNAKNASATPAQNVAFGSSLTTGEVLLWDCAAQNCGTAMSTTTGVFVLGYTPVAGGDVNFISIQGA